MYFIILHYVEMEKFQNGRVVLKGISTWSLIGLRCLSHSVAYFLLLWL